MNRQQPLGGELFEEGSLTAHRFGAASPFQPAQRILSRVCVGHDLDSRTQNLSAEPLPVLNLRHLHKVGDNLHFYYFSVLSVSNRGINRELVYSQLYIFNRLEQTCPINQSQCRTLTTQRTRTPTSQLAEVLILSRRTSAMATMVCSQFSTHSSVDKKLIYARRIPSRQRHRSCSCVEPYQDCR
jgi:hypothetical protein